MGRLPGLLSEDPLPCPALPALWQVAFSGWARMAQLIDKFAVTEVRKPKVGENKPAAATGGCQGRGGGGARGLAGPVLWATIRWQGRRAHR